MYDILTGQYQSDKFSVLKLRSEHFLGNNHSDTHMLLIPIEKFSNERDSLRKAREAHIIQQAKTFEPLGINKRDGL